MPRIHIAVGIVCDSSKDTVLVCLRSPDRREGGKWEFPGGKLEQGETVLQALKRELFEEVGIVTEVAHPLIRIDHDYSEGSICLHAWIVDRWSGVAEGKEGQALEWIARSDLNSRIMPAANNRIISALDLPPLYLITPDRQFYDDNFLQLTENLVSNGLRLLQFRSRQSTFSQHRNVVRELVRICNSHACMLIYNGSLDDAIAVGAHGVHLRSDDLMLMNQRPVGPDFRLSVSCHNTEQIIRANAIDSDFCVIAPVHKTTTHPTAEGMGWQQFNNIASGSKIPVYALGGIKPSELAEANANGAHGIAMISSIWNAQDPVTTLSGITTRTYE